MNRHDLKQLNTRLAKMEAQLRVLDTEKKEANDKYYNLVRKIKSIRAELKHFAKEPIVSEHAMLRYLERRELVDMKALRTKILPENMIEAIKKFGSGEYPIEDGRKLIVKDMVVVSVI